MRHRLLQSIGIAAAIALVSVTMARVNGGAQTRTPVLKPAPEQNAVPAPQTAAAAKTPWGEPDLQGIWSVELLVPLERPAGVTNEFYTEEEVAELDRQRAGTSVFGNHLRARPGTEADVAGAYNAVFTSQRPTGRQMGKFLPGRRRRKRGRQRSASISWPSCKTPSFAGTTCPAAAAGHTGRRHRGERRRLRTT